jgi:hypothetical protein
VEEKYMTLIARETFVRQSLFCVSRLMVFSVHVRVVGRSGFPSGRENRTEIKFQRHNQGTHRCRDEQDDLELAQGEQGR